MSVSLKKTMKEESMKKYLCALLAVILMTAVMSTVNAGSPQQCKDTIKQVLEQVGMKSSKPFWEFTDEEILEFKKRAREKGLWDQFAQVCNSWSEEQCKGCNCGPDFSDTACSPNCGCCWAGVCPK